MTEVENVGYENWSNGLTRQQWKEGWDVLKQSRTYEYQLGDLVLPGIAHCVKKDIIIFNTSAMAHSPIYVVEASKLCGLPANNEIPICLAYDQTHYEALTPDTNDDIIKTFVLKKSVLEGTYHRTMEEFPLLRPETVYKKKPPMQQQSLDQSWFQLLTMKLNITKIKQQSQEH